MNQELARPRADHELDVKGLNCPLPILKTKVLLNRIKAGEVIHVTATDPHSVVDFRAFCARTAHELVELIEAKEIFEFYIRRADDRRDL